MGVYYIGSIPCSGGDIYHFGRKGMKWGKRIFGDLADRLADRGWTGASRVARGISTGFGRANEFINGDQARQAMNFARGSKQAQAQAAYNRTLPGMIDQARGAVGNAAASARERATQAMADAREKVSNAYADAAKALGDKGRDIQTFYRDVMQKAQGAINRGKSMVTKYGGQFVTQIETLGKNALTGGKAFLDGIMERARNAGENAREFVTGNRSRAELESAKTALKGAKQKSRHFDGKDPDGSYSYKIKKDRDHPVDIGGKTYYPFVETGNRHSTEVTRQNERLRKAQAEYDKTLPGQIEKIKKKRKK